MSEAISLKKAERKVFSFATQDGLSDIFIGCIFLMWAIAPFLAPSLGDFWAAAVFVPFWGMVMLGLWLIRKHVVKPRIGVVKFGSARKTRLRKFTLFMLSINIIAFIIGIWISFNSTALSGTQTSAFFGVICLLFCSIAAYFLDFRRLYVYGLLAGMSPLIGEWLWARGSASHHGFPITFGITSSIMILTGLFLFIRLLRTNPAPAETTDSEDT